MIRVSKEVSEGYLKEVSEGYLKEVSEGYLHPPTHQAIFIQECSGSFVGHDGLVMKEQLLRP